MAVNVQERTVKGPAGSGFIVLTDDEETMFDDLVQRYMSDNSITNISDLQDLERIVQLEVLFNRYSNWLSTETDYYGEAIDGTEISRMLKDFSGELRQLKKSAAIDKPSRLKDSSGSTADFLEDLRMRAKRFGVMRENQLTKGITLSQELIALVQMYNNCTDEEKKENKVTEVDIIAWINEVYIPEFKAVDEHFRKNDQKFWIREQ